MTKDEIKRELDGLGIGYPKDAKVADLKRLLESVGSEEPFEVRVTAPLLNVRRLPDTGGGIDRTVRAGEMLEAVRTGCGWVELADGCFVLEAFVERA